LEWQVITGISSCIIALCALIFTICQGIQARKHNKLSYRPHLTRWAHLNAEKGYYAVDLINNGLGPALIENFFIKVDGKVISGEGAEPIEKTLKILFPSHNYKSQQSFLAKGYSMAAKERSNIVAVQFMNQPLPTREFVEHAMNRADMEIIYKSLYEETFRLSTSDEKPNKQNQPVPESVG
jgi:hypothetical protein